MSKEALLRTNQALDGDLSSVFRQRYAKPSTEYWGIFTPGSQEVADRDDFNRPPPQFTASRSEKPSSHLPQLLPNVTVTSYLNSSQAPHKVPFQNLEPRLSFSNGGGVAGNCVISEQVTNNVDQQYAAPRIPPQVNHSEVVLPVRSTSSSSLETEKETRRPRLSADSGVSGHYPGVKIRRFHGPSYRPRVDAGAQSAGWQVGNSTPEQQLLQPRYHQTCNDPAGHRAPEPGGELHAIGMDVHSGASGLQLVHLLLACAEAVDGLQYNLVHVILMRLRVLIEPRSNAMQRLAAIFVTALTARITRTAEGRLFKGYHKDLTVPVSESLKYFGVVYNYTPLGKLPHLTLNQMILDATEQDSRIHIIDLNTEWRGMQWPAFIRALAMRPGETPSLRITAFGSAVDLAHSQKKLAIYAKNQNLPLEFCPLDVDLKDFNLSMLDIRAGEVICINSFSTLHQFLAVGDVQVHRFLCDLKSLNPRVFTISDNDTDHNSPSFLHRFVECLKYYSVVFDALDSSIPDRESLLEIEQLFAGQKIRNIIACEGDAFIERHESMASWNRRMVAAGFQRCPVSVRAINQASLQLTMYYVDGFTLSIKDGYFALGWKNMPLMGISAWCSNHCASAHDQLRLP